MTDDPSKLEDERDAKYDEILDAFATQMKLGKYESLSEDDQERVEAEAETALDQWLEEAEASGKTPSTPLEKLYAEFAAIEARFPEDEEDGEDEKDEGDNDDKDKNAAPPTRR